MKKAQNNKKYKAGKKQSAIWWQVAIVIGIIIAVILLTVKPVLKNKPERKPAKHTAPVFKKEGKLSFYNDSTENKITTIYLEIADGKFEQERGLMYRTAMNENQGMLFIMDQEKPQYFWMKNTYISLDIIYLDKNLKIVTIQKYTQPLSEYSIPSNKPAKYVIEVVAGFCDRNGIKEGDFVDYERLE